MEECATLKETSEEYVTSKLAEHSPEFQTLLTFEKWDFDDDGVFSKDELAKVLAGCGVGAEECQRLFTLADLDKDGVIDYREFVTWLCQPLPACAAALYGQGGLQEVPWEKKEAAMSQMLTLLGKIIRRPHDRGSRHLQKSDSAFQEKLFSVPGCTEYLLAIGFKDDGAELVLPADADISLGMETLQSFANAERERLIPMSSMAGKWYLETDEGTWQTLQDAQDILALENAYTSDSGGQHKVRLGYKKFQYNIDFSAMTQTNPKSRKVRRLCRRKPEETDSIDGQLIDQTGKWYLETDEGTWQAFRDAQDILALENAYTSDSGGQHKVCLGYKRWQYNIDFSAMTQTNPKSRKVRRICRRKPEETDSIDGQLIDKNVSLRVIDLAGNSYCNIRIPCTQLVSSVKKLLLADGSNINLDGYSLASAELELRSLEARLLKKLKDATQGAWDHMSILQRLRLVKANANLIKDADLTFEDSLLNDDCSLKESGVTFDATITVIWKEPPRAKVLEDERRAKEEEEKAKKAAEAFEKVKEFTVSSDTGGLVLSEAALDKLAEIIFAGKMWQGFTLGGVKVTSCKKIEQVGWGEYDLNVYVYVDGVSVSPDGLKKKLRCKDCTSLLKEASFCERLVAD